MLKEISFYYQYQDSFKNTYCGRYILIKYEQVLGAFCTWQEACLKGLELCGEDSFFVKYCA
jgi:hypothetical protein